MQDYRKLMVWEKSHHMAIDIYKLTDKFPVTERYGLISQIRRSAVSVPSNIVEGCGRGSSRDFLRFLQIAFSSCGELEYQLLLSKDLGYMNNKNFEQINNRVNEIRRMLAGLIASVAENLVD